MTPRPLKKNNKPKKKEETTEKRKTKKKRRSCGPIFPRNGAITKITPILHRPFFSFCCCCCCCCCCCRFGRKKKSVLFYDDRDGPDPGLVFILFCVCVCVCVCVCWPFLGRRRRCKNRPKTFGQVLTGRQQQLQQQQLQQQQQQQRRRRGTETKRKRDNTETTKKKQKTIEESGRRRKQVARFDVGLRFFFPFFSRCDLFWVRFFSFFRFSSFLLFFSVFRVSNRFGSVRLGRLSVVGCCRSLSSLSAPPLAGAVGPMARPQTRPQPAANLFRFCRFALSLSLSFFSCAFFARSPSDSRSRNSVKLGNNSEMANREPLIAFE